jgi:exonuclease VII small subunit
MESLKFTAILDKFESLVSRLEQSQQYPEQMNKLNSLVDRLEVSTQGGAPKEE